MIFSRFDSVTEIEKGWSGDKKYCAVKGDTKYLLRISNRKNYSKIRKINKIMRRLAQMNLSMCKPVKLGLCRQGVYILQSFIDGIDAEENIHKYSRQQQYDFGVQAGRILKQIHTVPAPKKQQDWGIHYINANRSLIKNRPQCFQHGDYHIGNMMIENGKIVVIDFDRYDFGDPWEEFNRIVWAAQSSAEFATGMINGYFDNDVPELFWKLLKLYIGSNTLSSVPWAIPFGEEQIDVMLNQAKDVLHWYDNYELLIPKWYITEID